MSYPWSYITSLEIQHRPWNDPLFQEGNDLCRPFQKVPCVDLDDEELLEKNSHEIRCVFFGCHSTFSSIADHAAHQHACHSHMCGGCKRNLPSHHLLDLHLLEAHDSLFQLQAERQPMYQCLLESCNEKFKNAKERKEHCMSFHSFPPDFRFDLSWRGNNGGHKKSAKCKAGKAHKDVSGKDKSNWKKGSKQINVQEKRGTFSMDYEEHNMEASCNSNPEDMNTTTPEEFKDTLAGDSSKNMNSFHMRDEDCTTNKNEKCKIKVPKNICFGSGVSRGFSRGRGNRGGGRGRGNRGGGNPHWHQRHRTASSSEHRSIEEVNMGDIEQALNESIKTS